MDANLQDCICQNMTMLGVRAVAMALVFMALRMTGLMRNVPVLSFKTLRGRFAPFAACKLAAFVVIWFVAGELLGDTALCAVVSGLLSGAVTLCLIPVFAVDRVKLHSGRGFGIATSALGDRTKSLPR